MKKNKILLPLLSCASIASIVAPTITSCGQSPLETTWIKDETGKEYEGYTERYKDKHPTIGLGQAADEYIAFKKDVRSAINDDFINTLNASVGGSGLGTFTAVTKSFDTKTFRLTGTYSVKMKDTNKMLEINCVKTPMSIFCDDGTWYFIPLGLMSKGADMSIWQFKDWSLDYRFDNASILEHWSHESNGDSIEKFYGDYASYLPAAINYLDDVQPI